MNFKEKEKLMSIVEKIHLYIFRHKMSKERRFFLSNLSWSFFGGISASGLMLLAIVIAGRTLGPEEFGKYNLIIITGQFIIILMLVGLDISSVRSLAKIEKGIDKKREISTALISVFSSTTFVFCILFLFKKQIATLIHVDEKIFVISIFFAVILTYKMLGDGFVRGLHKFKYQASVRVLESIIVLSLLMFVLFVYDDDNYLSFVFSVMFGAIVSVIAFFFRVRKYINFKFFDKKKIKELFRYGKYVIIGSVVGIIFTFGDKFLVNKYLGIEELGVYMAYYSISIIAFGQLALIINNVFFPSVSKIKQKIYIMQKIDEMTIWGFLPLLLGMSVFIYIAILLFGDNYSTSIILVTLFAISGTLQFFTQFYAAIVNVHSEQTYFWGLFFMILRIIGFILFVVVLVYIGRFSVYALLLGYIANYIVDIFNLRFIIKKYARG